MKAEEIAKKHLYKNRAFRDRNGGYLGCAVRAITEAEDIAYKRGVEDEREACANIFDSTSIWGDRAHAIQNAIRARGNE